MKMNIHRAHGFVLTLRECEVGETLSFNSGSLEGKAPLTGVAGVISGSFRLSGPRWAGDALMNIKTQPDYSTLTESDGADSLKCLRKGTAVCFMNEALFRTTATVPIDEIDTLLFNRSFINKYVGKGGIITLPVGVLALAQGSATYNNKTINAPCIVRLSGETKFSTLEHSVFMHVAGKLS